jgi:hypothetical protein
MFDGFDFGLFLLGACWLLLALLLLASYYQNGCRAGTDWLEGCIVLFGYYFTKSIHPPAEGQAVELLLYDLKILVHLINCFRQAAAWILFVMMVYLLFS